MSLGDHKGRGNLKVLIIDNDNDSLKAIVSVFKNEGLTVLSTNSMHKALKIFNAENPTLIISEYILGEYHTALDFLRKLRKLSDHGKNVPFILHTNLKNKNALYQAELEGVSKSFIKPLSEYNMKKLVLASKRLIKEYKEK